MRGSVEEKILELRERKKQLFDAVIARDGVALKSLTETDVDDILGWQPAMATPHEIGKWMDASLEEVLLKLYPVTVLRWLYDVSLGTLADSHTNTLPQPDRTSQHAADKTPNKSYLIALMLAVLRNEAIGREFFQMLPKATRDVLDVLTWEAETNLAELETKTGCWPHVGTRTRSPSCRSASSSRNWRRAATE